MVSAERLVLNGVMILPPREKARSDEAEVAGMARKLLKKKKKKNNYVTAFDEFNAL